MRRRSTLIAIFVAIEIRIKQIIGTLKIRRQSELLPINRMEYRVFSQHREDGVIDHILASIHYFDLEVYQEPTSTDLKSLMQNFSISKTK